MTPKELAQAYVKTVTGPGNGWGQCVHPTLGRSDYILLRLQELVGREQCDWLVNCAFAESNEATTTGE